MISIKLNLRKFEKDLYINYMIFVILIKTTRELAYKKWQIHISRNQYNKVNIAQ